MLLPYVLLLTAVAGCGGEPKLFPVSGVVTLDGQPLADAGVLFVPVDKGPAASGTTDAAGKFRLTTTNRSGAIAGHYGVAISKQEVVAVGPLPTRPTKNARIKWIIPEKYSKAETSGLTAEVGPDQKEFTFAINSHK